VAGERVQGLADFYRKLWSIGPAGSDVPLKAKPIKAYVTSGHRCASHAMPSAAHPYYRVDVRDTRHLDFSDMAFWGGPLRERPVLGAIAPARVSEITSAIVRQYFDQELSGQRSPLLAGSAVFPEVTVRTVPPLAAR
jgi:hypothetical protein